MQYHRGERLGRWSAVKGPIIDQPVKLPRNVTQHHQQARLFTKEAGSTEGVIRAIGSPRYNVSVPLHALQDYTVLHTRKDGWAVFYRETDLSICVFNIIDPKLENLIFTPPITEIKEGKILSASLVGGTSLRSLEVFLIGSGVVEDHHCGILLHLGRTEDTWRTTRFPANFPTKAVGPLLMDGGVLMAILDGHFLVTHRLPDFSSHTSFLAGFRAMGVCTLVKGIHGTILAVQVPDIPNCAPIALEIGIGQDWIIPTITPVESFSGRCFLSKDDIGFTLPGGNGYFTNLMDECHLRRFLNGAWEEGFDAHPSCRCTGGFLE